MPSGARGRAARNRIADLIGRCPGYFARMAIGAPKIKGRRDMLDYAGTLWISTGAAFAATGLAPRSMLTARPRQNSAERVFLRPASAMVGRPDLPSGSPFRGMGRARVRTFGHQRLAPRMVGLTMVAESTMRVKSAQNFLFICRSFQPRAESGTRPAPSAANR